MTKKIYFGLHIPSDLVSSSITHCPLIKIIPYPLNNKIEKAFNQFEQYTHLIFTSQSAVELFVKWTVFFKIKAFIKDKIVIAIGKKTAASLKKNAIQVTHTAEEETLEGIIQLLENESQSSSFFWPHSALSRPLLTEWFNSQSLQYNACEIYTTELIAPVFTVNLEEFDELIFTSPSTVDSFLKYLGDIPFSKKITCIGPITQKYLNFRKDMLD